MESVWSVFISIALLLAVAARLALRTRGERAPSFGVVGRCLLAMAVGTAAFPLLLPLLGVRWWIVSYVVFVVVLTTSMTIMAVRKARKVTSGA